MWFEFVAPRADRERCALPVQTLPAILARLANFEFMVNAVHVVDLLQAKCELSRLVKNIERGWEREIVITRNGRAVAKLVPIDAAPPGRRIGVAKGVFVVPDEIDAHGAEVVRQFMNAGKS